MQPFGRNIGVSRPWTCSCGLRAGLEPATCNRDSKYDVIGPSQEISPQKLTALPTELPQSFCQSVRFCKNSVFFVTALFFRHKKHCWVHYFRTPAKNVERAIKEKLSPLYFVLFHKKHYFCGLLSTKQTFQHHGQLPLMLYHTQLPRGGRVWQQGQDRQ